MPRQDAQTGAWYMIPVRVLIATFVVTLMSFAVSLFLGIASVALAGWLRHVKPKMAVAYHDIAIPAAAAVAAIVLVSSSFLEYRHHRQAKTLDRIATTSRS